MGRSGLVSRGPGGRDWRQPGAAPGQRMGGPPRKRVALAGKKTKQTQITTPAEHKRVIRMGETIAMSDLAQKMGVKGNEVIKKLWALGMMGVNINQNVDQDTATLIVTEFGYQIESTAFREEEIISEGHSDSPEDLRGPRWLRLWGMSITARPRCSMPSARLTWPRVKPGNHPAHRRLPVAHAKG